MYVCISTAQEDRENYTDKRFSASKAIVLTLQNTMQLHYMDNLLFYHLLPTKSIFPHIHPLYVSAS